MWILRKPNKVDESSVTCIPVSTAVNPFTIGRLECSFNITDDKSVSRRHSSIVIDSFTSSTITVQDFGSKFGTWINGERISDPVQVSHGDSIKFGGLASEFILENRRIRVVLSELEPQKHCQELEKLRILSRRFGIDLIEDFNSLKLEEDYNSGTFYYLLFVEVIKYWSCGLLKGLLEGWRMVDLKFFTEQLLDSSNSARSSNSFSFAQILPKVDSSFVPSSDLLLPKRSHRKGLLMQCFEGLRRLILFQAETCPITRSMLKVIQTAFILPNSIEIIETDSRDALATVPFCDLLIKPLLKEQDSFEQQLQLQLLKSTRIVDFESLLRALLMLDEKLIEFKTIEPKLRVSEPVDCGAKGVYVEPGVKRESRSASMSRFAYTSTAASESSLDVSERTLSLMVTESIPSNLLRHQKSGSMASNSVKGRFVKCHPRHHQLGTIPPLIGPEQCTGKIKSTASSIVAPKKRILVQEAWLREDDSATENKKSKTQSVEVKGPSVKPKGNKPCETLDAYGAPNELPFSLSTSSVTEAAAPVMQQKFQSAFFRNLQNK